MRVAVLISGRLKCYESCLIPLLKDSQYDIDLFISINGERDEYHNNALYNLSKWLKGEYICPYTVPQSYKDIFINMNSGTNEPLPYNQLSMFFNDRNAFELATQYADDNNFEYDAYMKYRSDIITSKLPDIQKNDEYKIFSVVPWNNHYSPVIDRTKPTIYNSPGDWRLPETINAPWVSDAIVYGNRASMNAYTKTYEYCFEMNELWNGLYPIAFEPSVTQNVYDKGLEVKYFSESYTIDPSRHQ
jgi:hypothetical protein